MARPYDRPTNEPGGMECEECGVIFIGAEWHTICAVCYARTETARTNPLPKERQSERKRT